MRKILAICLAVCLCMTSFTYAVGTILLNPVTEIVAEWSDAEQLSAYMTANSLSSGENLLEEETITTIFRSGDTAMRFPLVPIVDNSQEEIAWFNDDIVMYAIEEQVKDLDEEVATKKADELISIINQVRALYRKTKVANLETGKVEEYYILDMAQELDEKSGELILAFGDNGEKQLLYTQNFGPLQNNPDDTNVGNQGGGGNYGGSSSNNTNQGSSQKEPVKKVLKDPPADVNLYEGEFEKFEARSAEYKVISKCWGNIYNVEAGNDEEPNKTTHVECDTPQPENILPSPDVSLGFVTVETKIKTYQFNLRLYYEQHTEWTPDEALALLTNHNLEEFEEVFKNEVIDELVKTVNGEVVPDEDARAKAWAALYMAVNEVRSKYGNIDFIQEDYKARQVYMYKEYLDDVENTIFARHPDGHIIAIKTDEFNDVFQQNVADGTMTDIIRSSDALSKQQYRLMGDANREGICNFYLCESCSKCEDKGCESLVASGIDGESDVNLYFSKYCVNHACGFVWECEVDDNNNGSKTEGLKCSEKKGKSLFCEAHTCRECSKAIVGVSENPLVDYTVDVDIRATGEKEENRYSAYCADHKCTWVDCRRTRVGATDTIATATSSGMMRSELCCEIHNMLCVVCEEPNVTEADYNASNGMAHQECAEKLKVEPRDVWQSEFERNGVLKTRIISQYAETVVFFPGREFTMQSEYDHMFIDQYLSQEHNTRDYLADKNIIVVVSPDSDSKWTESTMQKFEDQMNSLIESGEIKNPKINISGFSAGCPGSANGAIRLSSSNPWLDVNLALIDGGNDKVLQKSDALQLQANGVDMVYYDFGSFKNASYKINSINAELDEPIQTVTMQAGHDPDGLRKALRDALYNGIFS